METVLYWLTANSSHGNASLSQYPCGPVISCVAGCYPWLRICGVLHLKDFCLSPWPWAFLGDRWFCISVTGGSFVPRISDVKTLPAGCALISLIVVWCSCGDSIFVSEGQLLRHAVSTVERLRTLDELKKKKEVLCGCWGPVRLCYF